MDATRGKLAERVLQWATSELHYNKEKPNVQHVQKLCVGNMVPVWNFLLTHVKTDENLTQQRAEEEARAKLVAERDAARAALAETQANIAALQLEIANWKSDVEGEQNKMSTIKRDIREKEVRNTMLESYDRSQAVATNIMPRLLQVISHLKNQPNNTHSAATQKHHSTRDSTSIYSSQNKPVLETNSKRLIREICEFIKDAYDKQLIPQEIDKLVKDKLKDIFGVHGVRASEVLETLTHLAFTIVKSYETTKESTKKANGTAVDSKRIGVAEQLFNLRSAHAERFFRTIALRNACNTRPAVGPAPANLTGHAAQLRRMQSTLRGMHAALRIVNDKIAELQGEIETGIQSNVEERVRHTRTQLDNLLRIRGDHAREVVRLRAENLDYMVKINQARQVMSEILSLAREAFSVLRNAKLEIETLTKMDIARSLPATLGRNKDVPDAGILAAIKSPLDSGPESLLLKLFSAKVQLEEATQQVEYERRLLETAANSSVSVSVNNPKAISTIVKKNETFMEGQRQLAVRQQELRKETEQAINKASTIRQGADTWWRQPAQYAVPWVTSDGRSLEEFIREWRSLCSVLEIK